MRVDGEDNIALWRRMMLAWRFWECEGVGACMHEMVIMSGCISRDVVCLRMQTLKDVISLAYT